MGSKVNKGSLLGRRPGGGGGGGGGIKAWGWGRKASQSMQWMTREDAWWLAGVKRDSCDHVTINLSGGVFAYPKKTIWKCIAKLLTKVATSTMADGRLIVAILEEDLICSDANSCMTKPAECQVLILQQQPCIQLAGFLGHPSSSYIGLRGHTNASGGANSWPHSQAFLSCKEKNIYISGKEASKTPEITKGSTSIGVSGSDFHIMPNCSECLTLPEYSIF